MVALCESAVIIIFFALAADDSTGLDKCISSILRVRCVKSRRRQKILAPHLPPYPPHLFVWRLVRMAGSLLGWLVPQKAEILREAADGRRPREEEDSAPLSRFMNTDRHC